MRLGLKLPAPARSFGGSKRMLNLLAVHYVTQRIGLDCQSDHGRSGLATVGRVGLYGGNTPKSDFFPTQVHDGNHSGELTSFLASATS